MSYAALPPTDNGLSTYPLSLQQKLGEKRFEGKDHLGNVLSVLSDRTVPEDLDNNDVVERYLPLQLSQQYYYPFGDPLPMAGLASSGYRFGFQGQEHDDEIYGSTGTSYAFEYRIHDPRIGRFLSLDPLAAKYPWNSPYAFAENKVIKFIELEGLETADNKGDQPTTSEAAVVGAATLTGTAGGGAGALSAAAAAAARAIPVVGSGLLGWKIGTTIAERIESGELGQDLENIGIPRDLIRAPDSESPTAPVAVPTSTTFPGHGNRKDNSDPHSVYGIYGYNPVTEQVETLKYGISS